MRRTVRFGLLTALLGAGLVFTPGLARAACDGGSPDGSLHSTEECDDGNAINGDGCEDDCTVTTGGSWACIGDLGETSTCCEGTTQCTLQDGVCAGATKTADLCTDGTWDACTEATYSAHDPDYATEDTTCDGVDEDCSGEADEDYVSEATSCGEGACEATGQTECVDGSVEDSCFP
ncbi:MAG: hypothetical protein ACQEXJ_15825, partial [Myxococcota bacterium]